jgi:hypothetical protein
MKKLSFNSIGKFKDYKKYLSFASKNIRLGVLVLFAGMAGYLVLQVNALLSKDFVTQKVKDETATLTTVKKPDAEVLTLFNELNIQQVTLDSSFSDNRVNPF